MKAPLKDRGYMCGICVNMQNADTRVPIEPFMAFGAGAADAVVEHSANTHYNQDAVLVRIDRYAVHKKLPIDHRSKMQEDRRHEPD